MLPQCWIIKKKLKMYKIPNESYKQYREKHEKLESWFDSKRGEPQLNRMSKKVYSDKILYQRN